MKVSVIILNWNGDPDDCVEACQSALSQSYVNKEIIFIDNGSENASTDAVMHRCSNARIIYTGRNLGVAGGRNVGAAAASGELLFFLENDGIWESNRFIEEAVDLFAANPDMACMYCVVVGYQHGELQSHALVTNGPELVLVSRFSGGASVIRSVVFERLGGFPSSYFRQGEERFFSLLAYELDYKICYWTKHRLLHKGSSYSEKNRLVMQLNFENEMRTVARLFPDENFRLLFWLKALAWLPRFMAARDLRYFHAALKRAPGWLSERSGYRSVSLRTLALTEAITRGDFSDIPAEQVNICDAKAKVAIESVIMGFVLRWAKRSRRVSIF